MTPLHRLRHSEPHPEARVSSPDGAKAGAGGGRLMVGTRSVEPPAASVQPSVEDYNALVGQMELVGVWLRSVRVDNLHGPTVPDRAVIDVYGTAEWEALDDGFRALQRYRLRFQTTDATAAEIEVTFGLDYSSREPMTDPLFAVFRDVNLPVNAWPYLREYVATTVGRMGWSPVTLPTLKEGTRIPRDQPGPEPLKARARQRRTAAKPQSPRSDATATTEA